MAARFHVVCRIACYDFRARIVPMVRRDWVAVAILWYLVVTAIILNKLLDLSREGHGVFCAIRHCDQVLQRHILRLFFLVARVVPLQLCETPVDGGLGRRVSI